MDGLKPARILKGLATPIDLVGIRNKVDLYSNAPAFWEDKQMERLTELEQEYKKVKTSMDTTLHKINLLRKRNKTAVDGEQYQPLVDLLDACEEDILRLGQEISEVRVMPANQSEASDTIRKTRKNMARRVEEIKTLRDAIKQAYLKK